MSGKWIAVLIEGPVARETPTPLDHNLGKYTYGLRFWGFGVLGFRVICG